MEKTQKKTTKQDPDKVTPHSSKFKTKKEIKDSSKSSPGDAKDGRNTKSHRVSNGLGRKPIGFDNSSYSDFRIGVDIDISDEPFVKRERSLSDSSVKSLSWVGSEKDLSNSTSMRARSNTTNKVMWVPLATNDQKSRPTGKGKKLTKTDKPTSPEPVKPPRPKRTDSFKGNAVDGKAGVKVKHKHTAKKPEGQLDPVKPPRRKLPQSPRTDAELPKVGEGRKKHKKDGKNDEESREIISKPVVTSIPFQENMTLSVENMTDDDRGRRLLSIHDGAKDSTVHQGQSFYDFLYSEKDGGTTEVGAHAGGQIKDLRDDNLYDDVPLESSSQSLASLGRKSNGDFDIYDEVVVNKAFYLMPVDDNEDFSDSDPWGSDFDDDDDDDFENADRIIIRDQDEDEDKDEDEDEDDDEDSIGSGSYEEYKNTSAVYHATEKDTPPAQRRSPFRAMTDSALISTKKMNISIPGLKGIKGCFGMGKAGSLPYLASRRAKRESAAVEDEPDYVDPNIADTENYQQPVLPVMQQGLSSVQIKRYQIIKFVLESEADYMKLLDGLIKNYELPIRERDLLESQKIDIIFQGIHRVLDCHVMFNIALSARMAEWTTEDKIGDILYALFSKSMVLEAYSSYVNNFAKAMDTIKSACKTHLAFTQLLKARRQSSRERVTLHSLMLKPTKRFPQFIDLVQELLKVTPVEHPDRIPLQMALTQLEYLADNLNERKREAELRLKVKQLDASTAHISKPLSSGNRYFIRQDDFVQCVIEGDTISRTKRQRLIMLSDMLLCVSAIKGKKDRMANLITDVKAKYKLKWNVPLCDVEVIEYGPGINIYASPQRTTITRENKGQYRQHTGCQEHFADLQHDMAIIGQIAGLVATLRRSYQILDNDKVQKWHKAVQRTIEEESRLANLYWLELSLPAKTGRVNYIYSTESPSVKAEWLTALNTAVLRLAPENNPGWYLPEDDGTGGVAVQRRNMPLLKDNTDLFLLDSKARVQGIIGCPDASDPLPGIQDNYDNLWLLCGGHDSTGFVNVVKVSSSSSPQIIESFHVCESQILCGELVQSTSGDDKKVTGPLTGKFGFPFPTVWIGSQSGKIFIYNGVDSERRYIMSIKLPDAVLSLKAVGAKVFASLADGSVVVFKPNQEHIWEFSKPKAIVLSKFPVLSMALVAGTLWCGSGNKIYVLDHKKEKVKHVIEVDSSSKVTVHHLVCYGIGVWVSLWKQPTIKLYHSETMNHVQDMNIAYTVNTMQNDIDSQLEKTKLNKLYVSCMVAEEGLLWVGTSVGLVLNFPLPRLEGIPLVSGRACVSFHAYQGRVRSLYPLRNNPDAEVAIGPGPGKKKRYQLFRKHEMRDACVQTDAGISGISRYAANGPEPASKGQHENQTRTARAGSEPDEEDIHSDDEFSFVDDQSSYAPPTMSIQKSADFSVSIGHDQEMGQVTTSPPELGDTDFVKMMEDFKGFGTSPSTSVPSPPDVAAVLITGDIPNQLDKSKDSTKSQQSVKLENGNVEHPVVSGENSHGAGLVNVNSVGEESGSFRERVHSKGQYVKLSDAQKEAKEIGEALDDAINAGLNGNTANGSDAREIVPEVDVNEPVTADKKSPNESGDLCVSPPMYVSITNSPTNKLKTSDSDSENDESINRHNESVFSTTSSGVQSPVTESKKVVNLKSRLTYPVLLVTAGEGHLDHRRKRPDSKSTEPRIMIWQIN